MKNSQIWNRFRSILYSRFFSVDLDLREIEIHVPTLFYLERQITCSILVLLCLVYIEVFRSNNFMYFLIDKFFFYVVVFMYLFKLIEDNILLLDICYIYLKLTVLHLHFEVPKFEKKLRKNKLINYGFYYGLIWTNFKLRLYKI